MIKYQSDSEQGLFYMHHPTDRITHITASVTPVVEYWIEQEIAQWVHHDRIAGVVFYPGARCIFIAAPADGAMGIRIDPPMVDPLSIFPFQPVLHDWCYVLSCLLDGV